MEDILAHLTYVEQLVTTSLAATTIAWKQLLGSYYDVDCVPELMAGWAAVDAMAATTRTESVDDTWLTTTLAAPQVEQRTEAWYNQTLQVLTASEIWTIFKSVRERAQLVMTKTLRPEERRRGGQLCIPTEFMSAFDWGIRFEPVVKQLYEHLYGVKVKDVGRIIHSRDPRIAASPDGVVCPTAGPGAKKTPRLIEIKCPVSRDIGGAIPPEYYAQMQTQMEVTGAPICDYVEAKIRSGYKPGTVHAEGPALASGVIWRVENEADVQQYVYGPVYYKTSVASAAATELPAPFNTDKYVVHEVIYWDLMAWHEVEVVRDQTWWGNAQGAINAFWDDVERARRGDFTVPESSRKPRVRAAEADSELCLIALPVNEEIFVDKTDT
jgi:hypothetical protein